MTDWKQVRAELKAGWKEGGRNDALFFVWIFPLTITAAFLHAILTTKVPPEDLRIIVVSVVQLCWGYVLGWMRWGRTK